MSARPAIERIAARTVVNENGCWIWQGSKNQSGYGYIKTNGRATGVHRVAYELYVDQIPAGLDIDHLCRVRACCNPEHLEVVTHAENMLRSLESRGIVSANPSDPIATRAVCEILNVRPSTISRWVTRGFITPRKRLPGQTGALLFDPAEVERVRVMRAGRAAA